MGGSSTNYGITFQGAVAVAAALDLVQSGAAGAIELEVEGEDIVDLQVIADDGTRLRIAQAKTRSSGAWSARELIGIAERWAALEGAEGARFEFHTDATLSGDARRLVKLAPQAVSGPPLTGNDGSFVAGFKLDPAVLGVLARADARDRQGSPRALQALNLQRFSSLSAAAGNLLAPETAQGQLAALFLELQQRAGAADSKRALMDTSAIARCLQLDVAPATQAPITQAFLTHDVTDKLHWFAPPGGVAYVRLGILNPTGQTMKGTAVVVERYTVNGTTHALHSPLVGAPAAPSAGAPMAKEAAEQELPARTRRWVRLGYFRANGPLFGLSTETPQQVDLPASIHLELALVAADGEPREYDVVLGAPPPGAAGGIEPFVYTRPR